VGGRAAIFFFTIFSDTWVPDVIGMEEFGAMPNTLQYLRFMVELLHGGTP
jgi:hypothetical protein